MNNIINKKAVVVNATQKLALVLESNTEKNWNNIISWERIYSWDKVPVIFAYNEKEFATVIAKGFNADTDNAFSINIPADNMLKPHKLTISIPCETWTRKNTIKNNEKITVAEIFRYHNEKTIIRINSEIWGNKYCELKENNIIERYNAENDQYCQWIMPNNSKQDFIKWLKQELVVVGCEKSEYPDTFICYSPWFSFYDGLNVGELKMLNDFEIIE